MQQRGPRAGSRWLAILSATLLAAGIALVVLSITRPRTDEAWGDGTFPAVLGVVLAVAAVTLAVLWRDRARQAALLEAERHARRQAEEGTDAARQEGLDEAE